MIGSMIWEPVDWVVTGYEIGRDVVTGNVTGWTGVNIIGLILPGALHRFTRRARSTGLAIDVDATRHILAGDVKITKKGVKAGGFHFLPNNPLTGAPENMLFLRQQTLPVLLDVPVARIHPGASPIPGSRFVDLAPGTVSNRFRTANVQIYNPTTGNWVTKNARSTFFPGDWDEDRLLQEVLSTFDHPLDYVGNRAYEGWTNTGLPGGPVRIRFIINPVDNRIITFYPIK